MPEVLYRKYRPKNFNQLVGQDQVKEILSKAVERDSLSHAYIFSGSRGTGKTTCARILAKMLNCLSETLPRPCGVCESCTGIDTSSHMDVIELDAASYRGIDEIRKIRDAASYRPVMGRYKVYIIDEFHMLTREAFNALLKTLEEPPERVVFILATTNLEKVPETVLSRCQIFNFRAYSDEEIVEYLERIASSEGIQYTETALRRIATAAHGGMRDAANLLERVVAFKDNLDDESVRLTLGVLPEETVLNFLKAFAAMDPDKLLEVSKKTMSDGFSYETLLEQSIEVLKLSFSDKGDSGDLRLLSAMWDILKELRYAEDKRGVFEVMTILRSSELPKLEEKTLELKVEKTSGPDGFDAKETAPYESRENADDSSSDGSKEGLVKSLLNYLYEKDYTTTWVALSLSNIVESEDFGALIVKAQEGLVQEIIDQERDTIEKIATDVFNISIHFENDPKRNSIEKLSASDKQYFERFLEVFGVSDQSELSEFKIEIEED